MPDLPAIDDLPLILTRWVLFVFALTVHEAAHAWMAGQGGDDLAEREGRLTLNPLAHIDPIGTVLLPLVGAFSGVPVLCWARPVPIREGAFKHSSYLMWTALAGPASNLILAAWGTCIFRLLLAIDPALEGQLDLLYFFVAINVVLMVFNMIPIPPLDGSKVAWYLVFRGRGAPWSGIWNWIENYGFYLLIACVLWRDLGRVTLGPVVGFFQQQVWSFLTV